MCFTTHKRHSIQLGMCPHVPDTDSLINKNFNMKVTEKNLGIENRQTEDKMQSGKSGINIQGHKSYQTMSISNH